MGAEQLARAEEQGRRLLAAGGDDVVGGIFEPGPQAAGQTGIEAGTGGGIAAEEGQDLGPRASLRRRVAPPGLGAAADVVRRGPSVQCARGV